jgi:hypothetical protein
MSDAVNIVNRRRGGGGGGGGGKAPDVRFKGANNLGGSKLEAAFTSNFLDMDASSLQYLKTLQMRKDLMEGIDGLETQRGQLVDSIRILANQQQSPVERLYLALRQKCANISYYDPRMSQLRESFGDASLDSICKSIAAQKVSSAHMRAVLENTFGENDADITLAATTLHNTSRGGAADLGRRLGPLASTEARSQLTDVINKPLNDQEIITGYKPS